MTAIELTPDPNDDEITALLAACGLTPPPECGSLSGYMRHLRTHEEPCGLCRDAYLAARPSWDAKGKRPRPIEHGTPKGARAHQRRHEPACGPCARAYRAYQRDWSARTRAAA